MLTRDTPPAVFIPTTPFVLASPEETLVARGVSRVLGGHRPDLAGEVDALLAEREADADMPVLVGALPFDRSRPAHLYEPRTAAIVHGASSWTLGAAVPPPQALACRVVARPDRRAYEAIVAAAVARMSGDGPEEALRKVVLARSLVVEAPEPFDTQAILTRLRTDRSVTGFSVPLPERGAGPRTLVGATPELLVRRDGLMVTSTPLAGSIRRSADAASDRAAADALLRSDKDHREHALVVEWIADRLAPYCVRLSVPRRPSLASTSSLWHLATRISGELADRGTSVIALADALHPTPAVCGMPADQARDTIRHLEPFDRGFFTGAVGWCAANGDGQWLVAIRCADVAGSTAELFAGAGIVAGSEPAAEADETSAKFAALLDAMAITEQGAAVPAAQGGGR